MACIIIMTGESRNFNLFKEIAQADNSCSIYYGIIPVIVYSGNQKEKILLRVYYICNKYSFD